MFKSSSSKFTKITNKYLKEVKKLKIAYIKELLKAYGISEDSFIVKASLSGEYIKIELPNESYQMNLYDALTIYGGSPETFHGVDMFRIDENSMKYLKSYAVKPRK